MLPSTCDLGSQFFPVLASQPANNISLLCQAALCIAANLAVTFCLYKLKFSSGSLAVNKICSNSTNHNSAGES